MWIITKNAIINSQLCSMFVEDKYGTNAMCNTQEFHVSDHKVLSKILEAIKRGYPFLEVE